ncbi:protease-associated PA domain protein, precursor [Mycolicibacterium thermoresistibile]|uniref:Protease-associated PA domain protein n=1 Tax=Mycolicibacterium thermoresistibile TaxID=1797 RepID=A0A100XD80_MYCTH|nr:protease-associated PA domain protein, precursor [Mycolicibacterium thermoresistibile]
MNRILIGDIGADGNRIATVGPQLGGRLLGGRMIDVQHRDPVPVVAEPGCDRPPQPRSPSGHNRHSAHHATSAAQAVIVTGPAG